MFHEVECEFKYLAEGKCNLHRQDRQSIGSTFTLPPTIPRLEDRTTVIRSMKDHSDARTPLSTAALAAPPSRVVICAVYDGIALSASGPRCYSPIPSPLLSTSFPVRMLTICCASCFAFDRFCPTGMTFPCKLHLSDCPSAWPRIGHQCAAQFAQRGTSLRRRSLGYSKTV
jgi:hypothetical protein